MSHEVDRKTSPIRIDNSKAKADVYVQCTYVEEFVLDCQSFTSIFRFLFYISDVF